MKLLSFLHLGFFVLTVGGQQEAANLWPQCEDAGNCTATFPYCPGVTFINFFSSSLTLQQIKPDS
jgi:hypothetical protein